VVFLLCKSVAHFGYAILQDSQPLQPQGASFARARSLNPSRFHARGTYVVFFRFDCTVRPSSSCANLTALAARCVLRSSALTQLIRFDRTVRPSSRCANLTTSAARCVRRLRVSPTLSHAISFARQPCVLRITYANCSAKPTQSHCLLGDAHTAVHCSECTIHTTCDHEVNHRPQWTNQWY
jgi:hypothetical protein